ncbi:UNVERIFIED_CONTAM: hypothetical protein H355_013427 [Colinus virginianus]|nr:hypothetical protein H355_013427 [Colinus virginianus]
MKMAMSVIQACRSLALSTWLLSFCFVHLLCLDFTVAEKEEWYTAFVNITYADPAGGSAELRSEKSECGRYGDQSPKQDARGQVALSASPSDREACDPSTRFNAPEPGKSWVALIPGGNCTYKDKIRHAAAQNASAVVIYNVGSSNANETITMPYADKQLSVEAFSLSVIDKCSVENPYDQQNHINCSLPGAGNYLESFFSLSSVTGLDDVVAIMIPEPKGKEIVNLLERNITVMMYITIGTRNLQKYVSRTSVVFVSISFIVLMIISLAWLVFYYIQRFRYANARDRNQLWLIARLLPGAVQTLD